LGDNFFDLPFVMGTIVVVDDLRHRSWRSKIGVDFMRFEVCDRDTRMDFPCRGDVEFVGETTNGSDDFEGSNALLR
jgi:hypothetical protein